MNGQASTNQAPGVVGNDGLQGAKTLRMAASVGARQNLSRYFVPVNQPNDWPGRAFGIRSPYPSEIALSWAEVNHYLRIK